MDIIYMPTFFEALKTYRTKYGIPGGKAPKKGSDEYDAVKAMMGKPSASHTKHMKSEAAVHKKGEAAEMKHRREVAAAEKKAIADVRKRAKKGELSPQQMKAYASLL